MMVMVRTILKKDSHPIGLTLHLMISTTSTLPISTEILQSSLSSPGLLNVNLNPKFHPIDLATMAQSISPSISMIGSAMKSRRSWTNIIMKRRPTTSPIETGWSKSMNKIMEMRILLRTLNLILTITIQWTHVLCRTQK